MDAHYMSNHFSIGNIFEHFHSVPMWKLWSKLYKFILFANGSRKSNINIKSVEIFESNVPHSIYEYLKTISLIMAANRCGVTINGISFVWHGGSNQCEKILMQSVFAIHFKFPSFFHSFTLKFVPIRTRFHQTDTVIFNTTIFSPIRLFIFCSVIFLAVCGMQVYTVPFHPFHFSSSFNSNWSTISIWFGTKMLKEIQTEILHWIFRRILINESQFIEMLLNLAIFLFSFLFFRFLFRFFFSSTQKHHYFRNRKKTENDWLNCENHPNYRYM